MPNKRTTEENELIVEMVEKAKKGDKQAFAYLYNTFLTPIFRYIYFRVKNEQEAEDLTQVVFIKAWDAITRYENRGFSFTAWLYTISKNTITDYWKKKKDVILDEPLELKTSLHTVSDDLEEKISNAEMFEKIKETMMKLSEEQQNILTMKFINELSNKEISDITGKSETAIRSLQYRALKALSEYLKEFEIEK